MKTLKTGFKSIFSYIFLTVLYILAFAKASTVSENIVVISSLASLFLILDKNINIKIRIILITSISAVGIVSDIDFLFYVFPAVIMLVFIKYFADKKNKTVNIVFALVFSVHIISEIICLFNLDYPEQDINWSEKIFCIYFSFVVILGLAFIVLLVLNIKKSTQIKNQKKALVEHKEIRQVLVLCLINICYVVNTLIYLNIAYYKYNIYTMSVIMWCAYLVWLIKKINKIL